MKVLYIAPFRSASDYANAATNYVLALDAVGVDVVPRCILERYHDVPARMKELEAKSSEGCTHLIIHGPPNNMEWYADFKKCIGITNIETDNFANTSWASRLNLMDMVIVGNPQAQTAAVRSGIEKPVRFLPYTVDIQKYGRSYEPLFPKRDDFLFYTIGKANKRKNLVELLRAFHTEFRPEEPVTLLIKTGSPNLAPMLTSDEMRKISLNVKRDLRLYPAVNERGQDLGIYKQEIIISDWLTDEDMCRLHHSCDCYVDMASLENWNAAAFDAMAFGKTPLVLYSGGPTVYITNDSGFTLMPQQDRCFGYVGNSEAFGADEFWDKPRINTLQESLRSVYNQYREMSDSLKVKKMNGYDVAMRYDYQVVGNNLKEIISE